MLARLGVAIVLSVSCSHGGTAAAPASAPASSPAPPPAPAPVAATGDHPWGPPVASETTEAVVKRTLGLIGSGQLPPTSLAPSMTIGPALWGILLKLDPAIASWGTAVVNPLPHKRGAAQTMEMRTFTDDRAPLSLLRSTGFRKIGRAFSQATLRAATDGERELFYDFVPFEIAGKPVTISERDADRLVVYLDDNERIVWMDVISGYATAPAATPPAPAQSSRTSTASPAASAGVAAPTSTSPSASTTFDSVAEPPGSGSAHVAPSRSTSLTRR